MSQLKKSIIYSVGEKYLVFLIQFIATLVIARLLTPLELGIFSIASLIISFSHIFRDLGISNYIIQEKDLSDKRLITAQTILFSSSWILAGLISISSSYFANFYNEPKVEDILLILSINFIIIPFGALNIALLRRQMLFDRIFKISISASVTQTASAIVLCYAGYSSLGLAWSGVIGNLTTVLLTAYLSPIKIPLIPSQKDWRHVLGTGGRYSGASILGEMGLSGPELIAGKIMGLEYAAYLGRAQGVVSLAYRTIVEGLTSVLMPHFAQIHRAKEDLGKQFLIALGNLSAISFPIFLSMIVAMDSLVLVLYGAQWQASIIPAQIICTGMLFLSIATTGSSAVAGMGEAKYSLRFQLLAQPMKLVFVVVGCQLSLIHVATGMVAGEILLTLYILMTLRKLTHFSWLELWKSIRPSVSVAILTAGSCLLFRIAAHDLNNFWTAIGSIVFSAIAWLVSIQLVCHPIKIEVNKLAKTLRNNII
jgi:O-antigen/teichoic acid export membrane protein